MFILHIIPGANDPANGIGVAASLVARQQLERGEHVVEIDSESVVEWKQAMHEADEVWVHSMYG